MAVNVSDPGTLRGMSVLGSDGDKLGKVDEVYLDNETERPEWAAVKTGMFGGNVSLVPMSAADLRGDELTVPFSKEQIKGAPHHDPGRELSPDDERELYAYYGLDHGSDAPAAQEPPSADAADAGSGYVATDTTESTEAVESTAGTDRRDRAGDPGIEGHDTSGPTTDNAMTRSEEQLHVGTRQREAGTARLRKYVTTETETRTVPVSHEEATISREPITDANRGDAMSGGELTEEDHEVTLHQDEVVTSKETVPVERISLGTETVTEQREVSEQVSKENIEMDDSGTTGTTGTADTQTRDRNATRR